MSDDKELTPEELKAELEGARAQLKKVNAESAERRKLLEQYEAEKAKLEQQGLSEAEKLKAELAAIKAEHDAIQAALREQQIKSAVMAEAAKLGFANPDDAVRLVDLASVEIDDNGKVSGFEKSLKALVESNRLPMKDQKRSDGLGTPPQGTRKPSTGDQQEVPTVRF